MPSTRRETLVSVRLNDDEALRLDNACMRYGQNRSAYIRRALLKILEGEEQ